MGSSVPSGVLVVDKPTGPTSFAVVARVKRALRAEKAGHTGTLDPLATGVLAVCVGDGVKLQQYLTGGDKEYQAVVAFGAATLTQDAEGEITERADPSCLDAGAVRGAMGRFLGEIEQLPPMFSAVRVAGRRLHEAARAGEEVGRAPRTIVVHALELLELAPPAEGLVRARISVRCGKGTYVRTLAVDLGASLGLPAHLAELRRTAAGPFTLADALPLEEVERLARSDRAALVSRLLPIVEALRGWPAIHLEPAQARDLGHGRALAIPGAPDGLYRAIDPEGRLLAVCEARASVVRPVRVLPAIR
jgi:tRNA pseudouridine55 synthase